MMHDPVSDPVPLSYVQQRLWFLDQLDLGGAMYSMLEMQRLRGPLDVPALRRAVNAIVARHEVLRTCFVDRDGELRPIVEPARVVPVPVVDLHTLPADRREAHARLLVHRVRARPFDLARGPVLRVALLRLEADEFLFLRVFHHIAYDGGSRGIVMRELAALYNAFRAGRHSPLAPLPAQYSHFAIGQRRQDQACVDAGLAYWTRQLDGLPDRLDLPADRTRPAVHTAAAGIWRFSAPIEVVAVLKQVGRRHGATIYMMLVAGMMLLLRRYTDSDDVAIGSPISHREEAWTEEVVGCFVNLLVLRARMHSSMRIRDVIAGVQRTAVEAFTHRDVPFERVVEAVAPQRRLDRMPLFQVLFAMQPGPAVKAELAGLHVEPVLADEARVGVDLELYALERGDRLDLAWTYNSALFDPWRIEQMARHYGRALEAMATGADLPIDEIGWLDEGERRQLLDEWNGTARPLPDDTVAVRFASAVESIPDAVAVTCAGRSVSYRALDLRASRLARLLVARGTRPDDVIALAVPRSLEMVTALLAVLKAGAAYLPLDPEAPGPHLARLLQDASPRCVVTTSAVVGRLPGTGEQVLLDDPATESALSESTAPALRGAACAPGPQHAAYVIYTSGSTGRSKGVVGTYQGLINRLSWFAECHGRARGGPVLARSAFSFVDGSTELLGPLLRGGAIVLATAEEGRSLAALASLVQRHGAGMMTVVPSLLRALVDEVPAQPLATCRAWITSGERLPGAHAQAFHAKWPASELLNLYGASEATGDSLWRTCGGGDVAIGAPIWNTQAYVLDPRLALVPVGVVGELYLAGDGLARGYLRQPGLTAARFVPNPYGEPGTRMYRTGDLARWRRDGNLEYLGRTDDQVKVRGCRVEPGELQAALAAIDGVADAAVVARPDARGETCLVGYVVPASGRSLDPRAIRDGLRHRLPDYLVPAALVAIDRLPVTSHGKLDRRALLAKELPPHEPRTAATPAAERVCGLIADVLGVDRVDTGDNFFDLGGHSLLAMRLANRLGAAFGVRLSVRAIFEARTVGELAQSLNAT